VLPALAGAVSLLLAGSTRHGVRLAGSLLWVGVTALLWFPLVRGLELGMGLQAPAVHAAAVGAALLPVTALLSSSRHRRPALAGLTLAALVAAGITATRPAWTDDHPRPLNLLCHVDASAGSARWLAASLPEPLPARLQATEPWRRPAVPPLPWMGGGAGLWAAPAPDPHLPPPAFQLTRSVERAPQRRVVGRLRSPRGAPVLHLFLPDSAGLVRARLGSRWFDPVPSRRGWHMLSAIGLPAEGVEVELILESEEPAEAIVADDSPGLPPEGRELIDARPDWAVPIHSGDRTVVTVHINL